MSDCCSNKEPAAPSSSPAKCPQCGESGRAVETVTLKHMVKPEFLDAVNKAGFQFCRSADCDVVYFHQNGERLTKADVRVRVGLKEAEDPVPICYCFGFTEAMAKREIESTGQCTIPNRISTEMKKDLCACEIRNPQGSCCLGNVTAAIKRLLASRAKTIRSVPVVKPA